MKAALTAWEKRISPVFDSAHTLLIAEIENGEVRDKHYEPFDPNFPWRLANKDGGAAYQCPDMRSYFRTTCQYYRNSRN